MWITNTAEINQIANRVWTYNSDNKYISKKAPDQYYQEFCEKEWTDFRDNLKANCIPENFYKMEFNQFLDARRELIFNFIREYYDDICNPTMHIKTPSITTLIAWWESINVEFKSSIRWNYYQNKVDDGLRFQIIKTIAAFLNTEWGRLFVWVKDDWTILWEDNDINSYSDKTLDSLLKDVDNLIKDNFSKYRALIDVKVEDVEWKKILLFEVSKSHEPAYFTHNWKQEFYVRNSASSISLSMEDTVSYVKTHFN